MTIDNEPILLFIDTCTFESQNYAFGGVLLKSLVESCQELQITLVVPDVTIKEICRRIKKNSTATKSHIKNILKDCRFLGHDREVYKKLRDNSYFDNLAEHVIVSFKEFLSESNAVCVPVDNVIPSNVFDKYFAVLPPFGHGNKEKEFPDAFALEAARLFASDQGMALHVVSNDNDLRKACEEESDIVFLGTIENAIEFSLSNSDALIAECHEWITNNINDIYSRAKQELKTKNYELNAISGHIHFIDILDIELLDESVIGIDDFSALIAGTISAQAHFNVEYDIEAESYYDSDDRLVIPYKNVSRELEVYLLFPVQLKINIAMREIQDWNEIIFDIADDVEITPDDFEEFQIRAT